MQYPAIQKISLTVKKNGNGELDISEGVLNSIASNASPEEQEQLKHFQNSLHQAYHTDGESHSQREKRRHYV